MKTFKSIIIFWASLLLMTGCYELDRFPADKLSSGTFWKTKEHADQGMRGVYAMLRKDNVYGLFFNMDVLGGVSQGYDPQSLDVIARGLYTDRDGTVSNRFSNLYEGISRANIVLQNLESVDMSEEDKTVYKAEAKFLRAFFYSQLLDLFGGVPLYDETTVVGKEFNNMLKSRSSAEETRAFILKDLNEAELNLPEEWDNSNRGRATQGSATALKGKIFLFNKQYPEAAICFESVVNSHDYELYPDYANLFKPGGDESSEMIFAVQNIGGVGTDFGMPTTWFLGTRSSFGSCWNNVEPSVYLVDSYEWKDGRPFDWEEFEPGLSDGTVTMAEIFNATLTEDASQVASYPAHKDKLRAMYEGRDPRLEATVITPYSHYLGWVANAPKDCEYVIAKGVNEKNGFIRENKNNSNYLYRKFVAEGNMDGMINSRAHTPINFPIIRYADVLLMLAECYNEMERPDEAVALINQVRSRVGMPGINSGPDWLSATTHDEIFQRIKHERAVELACEGHSFADMKRWKLLETLNGRKEWFFTHEKVNFTRVVNERDYLWPIPAVELERNENLIGHQNPGW